ncbi:MAG: hypothetical protein U5J63_02505 [Fodinibius sp.]|nr:hypothetical protein [Fodinibius sp.]
MIHDELHVFEKSANLFWGLVILVCTAGGTYLLAGTFVSMDWEPFRPDQLFALALFSLSFWGLSTFRSRSIILFSTSRAMC